MNVSRNHQLEISQFVLHRMLRNQSSNSVSAPVFSSNRWRPAIRHSFQHEISKRLAQRDFKRGNSLERALGLLAPASAITEQTHDRISRLAKRRAGLKSEHPPRQNIESLRCALDVLQGIGQIEVAVPADLVSSIVVLIFLRLCGVPLSINYSFCHALDVVQQLNQNRITPKPDVCVLSFAPALSLIQSSTEYGPEAVMPRTSRHIVAPRGLGFVHDVNQGNYIFMTENPGTSSFYFHELERRGIISRRRVSIDNVEPDEAASVLNSGDRSVRAILGYPFYFLNELFNGCTIVHQPVDSLSTKETIMFVNQESERMSYAKHALKIALNEAWNRLSKNGYMVSVVADLLLQDHCYSSYLFRASGLHSVTSNALSGVCFDN